MKLYIDFYIYLFYFYIILKINLKIIKFKNLFKKNGY